MNSRRALDAAIMAAVTALTRFAFRSHYLYDIDSVNFALALKRFDPSVHQPHPPGYFRFVTQPASRLLPGSARRP